MDARASRSRGHDGRAIVRALNDERVRAKRRVRWQWNAIYRILARADAW